MIFQSFARLRAIGRAAVVTAVVAMTVVGVAGTAAAAQQQPSNMRGFSAGANSWFRSDAETQAVNGAFYNANSAGWQSSWCELTGLTSFPDSYGGWFANASITCVQEPTVFLPGVPWSSGPNLGLCIGGELCHYVQLNMPLTSGPTYIGQVSVTAHDNFGDKTTALLGLFADGVQIGSWQDVKRDGSTHTFSINRSTSELTFRSKSTQNSNGTDETIINSIAVN